VVAAAEVVAAEVVAAEVVAAEVVAAEVVAAEVVVVAAANRESKRRVRNSGHGVFWGALAEATAERP
jgi:hypothetical protein